MRNTFCTGIRHDPLSKEGQQKLESPLPLGSEGRKEVYRLITPAGPCCLRTHAVCLPGGGLEGEPYLDTPRLWEASSQGPSLWNSLYVRYFGQRNC